MIRHDHVQHAFAQRRPEPLAVFPLADRRRALELRRPVGDLLGREEE
jgi:hypothetical protein